jgi:hypothetical protein
MKHIIDIDPEMIIDSIAEALEAAGSDASEEQFFNIVKAIDGSFHDVIKTLTEGMAEHWRDEARRVSTGWGSKYAATIKTDIKDNKGIIYIDKSIKDKTSDKPAMLFVNMVEEGMKSWSIKDALLKSEKAKYTKANHIKYIVVPFPVSTPRRPDQGTMQSKFGGREMTDAMYKIVKNGGKLKSGSVKVKGKDINVSGLTKYVTPQRQTQYGIFRMVTKNSKGWMHPGVQKEPVYKKVLAEVNRRIHEVITEYCKEIVREYTT